VLTEHGVPIASSTYFAAKADPVTEARWAQAHQVNTLVGLYRRNRSVCGVRKMWRAMRRAGHQVGRDQVARLMDIASISGAVRGRHTITTTRRDDRAPRHPDLVGRRWQLPTGPDQLYVADFTYVWTLSGFCYVAFVVDVFSRRILGWKVSTSRKTELVQAALAQALFTRRRTDSAFTATGPIHHSDAGVEGSSWSWSGRVRSMWPSVIPTIPLVGDYGIVLRDEIARLLIFNAQRAIDGDLRMAPIRLR
jgi:transposase InsO family protein